jgi:hypothetical protein
MGKRRNDIISLFKMDTCMKLSPLFYSSEEPTKVPDSDPKFVLNEAAFAREVHKD